MSLCERAEGPVLETHNVTITYLEQTSRTGLPHVPPPTMKCALLQVDDPPPSFYRYLFNTVGAPHRWVSRRYLTDTALSALITPDTTRIYVLYKDGWPAGFAETNAANKGATEIKFFGLVPEARGLGLGAWFFREVLTVTWDLDPKKIIIETCTLDEPGALRLYQRMGFDVYDQAKGIVEWRG